MMIPRPITVLYDTHYRTLQVLYVWESSEEIPQLTVSQYLTEEKFALLASYNFLSVTKFDLLSKFTEDIWKQGTYVPGDNVRYHTSLSFPIVIPLMCLVSTLQHHSFGGVIAITPLEDVHAHHCHLNTNCALRCTVRACTPEPLVGCKSLSSVGMTAREDTCNISRKYPIKKHHGPEGYTTSTWHRNVEVQSQPCLQHHSASKDQRANFEIKIFFNIFMRMCAY